MDVSHKKRFLVRLNGDAPCLAAGHDDELRTGCHCRPRRFLERAPWMEAAERLVGRPVQDDAVHVQA